LFKEKVVGLSVCERERCIAKGLFKENEVALSICLERKVALSVCLEVQ
jgi:hypothetical protein